VIDIQNRSSLDNYLNPPSFWYLSNSFDEFASVSQLWRQSLRRCLRWTAAATQLPGSPGRCETTDRRSPLGWERKTWWCWFSGDGWCSLSWCTAWRRSIVKNDPVHWVTGMILQGTPEIFSGAGAENQPGHRRPQSQNQGLLRGRCLKGRYFV